MQPSWPITWFPRNATLPSFVRNCGSNSLLLFVAQLAHRQVCSCPFLQCAAVRGKCRRTLRHGLVYNLLRGGNPADLMTGHCTIGNRKSVRGSFGPARGASTWVVRLRTCSCLPVVLRRYHMLRVRRRFSSSRCAFFEGVVALLVPNHVPHLKL